MVRQCVKCNKLFEDILEKYDMCPDCRDEEEALLRDVKDYLWNNPGATEGKLAELFGVNHKQIVKWLREERIEVTPVSKIKLTCLRCGSMIGTGKYCPDCKSKIITDMHSLQDNLKPKNEKGYYSMVNDPRFMNKPGKMHFLQNVEHKLPDEKNTKKEEKK